MLFGRFRWTLVAAVFIATPILQATTPAEGESLKPDSELTVQAEDSIIQFALLDPASVLDELDSPWEPEPIRLAQAAVQPQATASAPSSGGTTNATPTRAPARRSNATTASRRSASVRSAAGFASLASVPYMIGDTGSGTCLAFSGILDMNLSHPTLTCSRLNVSENNSTLPQDRVYYSYRHFHNATALRIYQFERELDVDRHTIALEKTFAQGDCSLEVRVPFEQRLKSEFDPRLLVGFVDLIPGDDRNTELANMSLILKSLLFQSRSLAVSAGIGVTLPTAQGVTAFPFINGPVTFANAPGLVMDTFTLFRMQFENETVYLSPFASWLYRPSSRWFHHGFLQFEFAANPSKFIFEGASFNNFSQGGVPVGIYHYGVTSAFQGELQAQSLARLNLGTGYVMYENVTPRRATRLTSLLELHYTSPMEDAKLTNIPLTVIASAGLPPLQTVSVGNQANRVDILNLATGVTAEMGYWSVTNGIVAPLRTGSDRGFDLEYNLQVQRKF